MANALRGQVDLKIGDHSFTLKPSFDTLATLETEFGKSIFGILSDLSNPRTCRVSDIAKLINIASGRAAKTSDIGEWLIEYGATSVLTDVFQFLNKSVASDKDLEDAKKKLAEAELSDTP